MLARTWLAGSRFEAPTATSKTPNAIKPTTTNRGQAFLLNRKTMASRPNNRPKFANTRGRNNQNNTRRPDAATQNPGQWQQRYDHYADLARRTSADDPVARELHWQHAEHFRRLMNGSAN